MKTSFLANGLRATTILVVAFAWSCQSVPDSSPPLGPAYLHFPSPLVSTTPWDIDLALKAKLEQEKKFPQVQRLFEVLSWQAFVALNWPQNAAGEAQATISSLGEPRWFSWKESFEVYKPDGSAPSPWGETEIPDHIKQGHEGSAKVLFRTSKFAEFSHPDTADEISQAFTAPIWDQNGNIVRYEVRMNEVEFDYLVENQLYNFDGQIAFSKTHDKVNFPSGNRTTPGVVEIKIAWKIMTENDFQDRYYTTQAVVFNPDSTYSEKTVGMVGMHIAMKSESAPQWIWATFEQVDNLEVNALTEVNGKALTPSFNDPNCQTCPVNLFPDTAGQAVIKNQIQRVIPISEATQALNHEVQALLAEAGSPFQYYQLIGTQWPTDPSSPPYVYGDTTVYSLPEAVSNKSGGKPTPAFLTNMIMETYFQGGTIGPNPPPNFDISVGGEPYTTGVNSPFNVFLGNQPAFFQIQGFPRTIDPQHTQSLIFGTESCVGCHFSGSIATGYTLEGGQKKPVFGKAGASDFSWLLQLKGHFIKETDL